LMQPDFISLGNKESPWQDIIKSHKATRLIT